MRCLIAFAVILVAAGAASAQTAVYTFEFPIFSFGEFTPMANRSPNGGTFAGFTASFSSNPAGPLEYEITNVASFPLNPLLNGQFLFLRDDPQIIDQLLVQFSAVVNQISFSFAVNGPPGTSLLEMRTYLLGVEQSVNVYTAGNVGGLSPGGTVNYLSETPFDSVVLRGALTNFDHRQMAIDNLVLSFTPVPEPSSLLLLGGAAAAVGCGWRRRRRSRNAV